MAIGLQERLEALAWQICAAERVPIKITTEDKTFFEDAFRDAVLLESEEGVRFSDETAMVEAAVRYVLRVESVKLLKTPKECFAQLHDIWAAEIGRSPTVSGLTLASLHNASHLDAYAWGRQAIEAGADVFNVLQVLEGAVGLFEQARAEVIHEFFSGHYEQVKNDLMGGLLYAQLPPWFAQHPEIARELKKLHETNPLEHGASLYGCALHGLILHDFADGFALTLASARGPDAMNAGPALHILGLVNYGKPEHREALDQVIQDCTHILRMVGHQRFDLAVSTLGRLITWDEKRIVELLSEAGGSEAPEALYRISEVLLREHKSLGSRDWYWPLFLCLVAAKREHGAILRNIDMVLMGYIGDPIRETRTLEFLDSWIARQPVEATNPDGIEKHFSSTFHRLVGSRLLFSKVLTSWLLHEDNRYPMIAQKAVSRLRVEGGTSLALDSAQLDQLSPNDFRFLLRRILGYIIGDEVQISMVFSLIQTKDAQERSFGYVRSVLRDQVGYDYPYQTIEFLKRRQSATNELESVKTFCGELISELQTRLDVLDSLPRLKEFRAASSKVRRFAKERSKQMNEAFEEASKNSIFRQIATNVVLKAGRRTFQNINGSYTQPMELKGISHSIALPRSEISDPAGAARERLFLRRAKRDTP